MNKRSITARAAIGILTIGIVVTILTFGQPLNAYKISVLGTIHEAMTFEAERCLNESGGSEPNNCDRSNFVQFSEYGAFKPSAKQKAAQWSDDPTNMIGNAGVGKFLGLLEGGGCQKLLRNIGTDTNRRAELGLLCNSHYGDLQFMHAQASVDDKSRKQTVQKMLDWSRLAYRVAVDDVSNEILYCKYFDEGNGASLKSISKSLVDAIRPFCDPRPRTKFLFIFKRADWPAWRMHSLFSMTCKGLVQSKTCIDHTGKKNDEMAQRNAIGSILHMIQDSYSQSHTVRGAEPSGKSFSALVRCEKVELFYEYGMQVRDGIDHGSADKLPKFECEKDSAILDPISASARALYFIEQGKSSMDKKKWEEKLVEMIRDEVIG